MEIENKYLRVAYTLYKHRDGVCEEWEKTTKEQPFAFLTGVGYTLDAFEERLKNLKKGEEFDFTIPSAEAFGEYEPTHVQEHSREDFTINGKFDSEHIYEGNIIEMVRNIDKSIVYAVVKEVTPMKVVMDFNHPLAGCDLQFVGSVVESRPATEKEIKKFEDSLKPSGCSCGCSGCGGGSCGDGCGEEGCGGCH